MQQEETKSVFTLATAMQLYRVAESEVQGARTKTRKALDAWAASYAKFAAGSETPEHVAKLEEVWEEELKRLLLVEAKLEYLKKQIGRVT